MADCGAAGTALDRAVRAATGHQSGSNGSKQTVVNLLGHVGTSEVAGSMPLAPPSSLVMPSSTVAPAGAVGIRPSLPMMATRPVENGGMMDHAWAQQRHPPPHVMQQHPQMMHPSLQHQQHHHSGMMMMMQQQQMMQQMQQMNAWMSQHKAARDVKIATQKQDADVVKAGGGSQKQPDLESWYEGLEEDALHEGGVQGATIEELAAAWQAAEADYYDDAVNLAAGVVNQDDDATLLYPYTFSEETVDPPQDMRDWMKEGVEWFDQGQIAKAISCFETEARHVHPDNARAWHMLGKCHAENDEDRKAIACLERSVERDPYNPQALLALGVSYVNELHPGRALQNLKAWITHNPRYAGLELDDDMYGSGNKEDNESEFDQVQRLLLRALEYGEDGDGDIQEALGVVYNVSRDYGAAVEAFRKALKARGESDYSLWNKLGATLANSNQSDAALPAYHRALQLKPKYARAWLNMAISHSNLQNYEEAARCYLQTLSLNPAAVHCWSYLRIALSCSEQWDLIPLAAAQDLKAFRDHYDFVVHDSATS